MNPDPSPGVAGTARFMRETLEQGGAPDDAVGTTRGTLVELYREIEQLRAELAALHGAALPEAGGDRRWICEGSGAGMGTIGGPGFTPCPQCRPAPGGDALGVETTDD